MRHFKNALSLTSQFFFCGLPLRLDSYRGCGFQCSFCFARYRGGNAPAQTIIPADPSTLQRTFERAFGGEGGTEGMIAQFLRQRVPVHFGGMSDPFQEPERRHGVSKRFLQTLARFKHPVVVSTRSTMPAESPYLELLEALLPSVVVQFSFTSTETEIAQRFEPFTAPPPELLATMEKLSARGIPVTCRWQPYVPGVSEAPGPFVRRVAGTGARHVALEHLKLPVEQANPLWARLVSGAGQDLQALYLSKGARLQGRELVLPPVEKIHTILAAREAVHAAGLTFGAADNEFQYLSDTGCCCSGVDQFPGFDGWFKHQAAHAVRSSRGKPIERRAIEAFWTPKGSVDRWLNSRSRLGGDGSLSDHLRARWNEPKSSLGPGGFYGVEATDELDADGYRVFRWSAEGMKLLAATA